MMRLAFVSLASFLLPTLSRRSLALDRRGETTLGGGATRGSLGGTRGIPSAQTPATFALLAPREHRLEPRHRGRIFLRADLIETRLETRGTSRPRGALEGYSARTDTEFQSVRGDAPQDDCCAGAQPNEREPAVISPVRPPPTHPMFRLIPFSFRVENDRLEITRGFDREEVISKQGGGKRKK